MISLIFKAIGAAAYYISTLHKNYLPNSDAKVAEEEKLDLTYYITQLYIDIPDFDIVYSSPPYILQLLRIILN